MKYKYWLACMAQMAENIGTGKVEKLFRFAGSARVLYDMSERNSCRFRALPKQM